MKKYLIAGGRSFIGSSFIHYLIEEGLASQVINLDKVTYAGNIDNLISINEYYNYSFIQKGIRKTISWYLDNKNW